MKMLVVGVFLVHDSKVLLVFRKNTPTDNGCYGLVGGKVGLNEAIDQAAIREVKEEVGIDLDQNDIKLIHVISFKKSDGQEVVSFDFIAHSWKGEPYNNEPHKHDHIAWFSLEELPPTLIDRHKKAYELYKKGILYSTAGYELIK